MGRSDPDQRPPAAAFGPAPSPRVLAPPLLAMVSACLVGRRCRYDGLHNRDRALEDELAAGGYEVVAYCPEEAGGLGTPRPPAWISAPPAGVTEAAGAVLDGRATVVRDDGVDVTAGFLRGARGALDLCLRRGITRAFLKERSPSCGCAATHVAGALAPGPGVTTALLRRHGIECTGVEGRRPKGPQVDPHSIP